MGDWQPIETYDETRLFSMYVLVSDGTDVYLGWLNDDGWHDATNPDYADEPLNPQPTHWMPLPLPPQTEGGE